MSKLIVFLVAIISAAFYGLTCYYIGRKLFLWIKYLLPNASGLIFAIVFGLLSLTLIFSLNPFKSLLKDINNVIGSYWMGIYIYLLIFFIVLEIVTFILKRLNVENLDKISFFGTTGVILFTIIVVSYGVYNATQIKHVTYEVGLDKFENNENMKIVMISDLHLGAVGSEKRLSKTIEEINKLKPDIVCMVGDVFNDNFNKIKIPEEVIKEFKKINSTYGVYASLGNHDGGKTFNDMVELLDKSNITLLNEEAINIDDKITLLGRLDPSPIGGYYKIKRTNTNELLKELDTDKPIIVMDHTPSNLGQYGDKVDLIMSGHTHKGQLFPGGLITNLVFEVDYGYYKKDENNPHVIVSSGVGTWGMPMRVGTNNEIVSIELKSK